MFWRDVSPKNTEILLALFLFIQEVGDALGIDERIPEVEQN